MSTFFRTFSVLSLEERSVAIYCVDLSLYVQSLICCKLSEFLMQKCPDSPISLKLVLD